MNIPHILKFLKDVAKHNDREWFEKNKGRYLEAKDDFEKFIETLLGEMVKVDESLAGLNPRKLIFRIYRDVRFSKDKRPYKTNMGAGFSPNGKLVQEPGYYFQVEPGNSFLAAGIYMPDAPNLAKVRQEIDYNAKALLKILSDKKFKKYFDGLDEFDKLKTMPKGYAKDHPHIELLKNKSFIITHAFTDKEITDPKFLKNLMDVFKAATPFKDFLNEALA